MTARTPFLFSFCAALLLAVQAGAAEEKLLKPLNFTGLYAITWGSITLGHIILDTHQTGGGYEATANIKTSGLAKLFSKHKSVSTAKGKVAGGRFTPTLFDTNYSGKKSTRHITLKYDKAGVIEYEYNSIPDNRKDRPAVTAKEKKGSIDPLTTLYALRPKLLAAIATNKPDFSLMLYEGRRLMEISFSVQKVGTLGVNGKKYKAAKVKIWRTPKAGFTTKELSRHSDGEPEVMAYFTVEDTRVYPASIEVDVGFGTLRTDLVRECTTAAGCKP